MENSLIPLQAIPLVYQVSSLRKRKLDTEGQFSHLSSFSVFLLCVAYFHVKLLSAQRVITWIPSL